MAERRIRVLINPPGAWTASMRPRTLKQDRITGTTYLDPGDRLAGRYDPPRPCTVLTRWCGPGLHNVAVRYADDGSTAVIPFPRRLRKPGGRNG